MNIVIIDYSAGNTRSVLFALQRLGHEATVSSEPDKIKNADKVIIPGVGQAGAAMDDLKQKGLDKIIVSLAQPVLGICLGMQVLCDYSEESDTRCLGIFNQQVKKFTGKEKIPQTGWNNIFNLNSELFTGIPENSYMYFVHSYYAETGENTIGFADYLQQYSAALKKNNFYAVQFHPEKSGEAGQKVLENFLKI